MKSSRCKALLCAWIAVAARAGAAEFASSEIKAEGRIYAVAFKDINGDGRKEVAIASAKQDDAGVERRYLAFFEAAPDGTFNKTKQLDVPDDAVAFGLGDLLGEGKPRVIYFTADSVVAMPGDGGAPRRLIESQRFFFNRPDPRKLVFWPHIEDLNGDGRDDLILADPNAYLVFLQDGSHALRKAGRIEAGFKFTTQEFETAYDGGKKKEGERRRGREMETSEGRGGAPTAVMEGSGEQRASSPISTSRALNRIAIADANADKRLDLMAMKKDKLFILLQKPDGGFGEAPDLSYPLGPQNFKYAWGDDRLPVSHGDINGDGRVDFVVAQLDTKDLTTKLMLHMNGDKGPPAEPGQIIKVSGLGDVAPLIDVNGDGALDLAYLTLRADKMLQLKKPQAEEVDATAFVFLFDAKAGQFSRSPDLKREYTIAVTGDQGGERAGEMTNFDGDFNGDGARDLLVFENRGKVEVFPCATAKGDPKSVKLASKAALELAIPMPEGHWILDLDGDRKSELALRFNDKLQILRAP